ncbi:MAG TPA: hypothetical protein VJ691_07885, partial [Vicinamibacterales bacterium]|nr:hypothetical protein [Vicinamibacterales bacterium]
MTSIRRIAIAAVIAAVPSVLLAGGSAQLAASSEFCWRSIEPDYDLQGQSPAIPESMLVAAGPGEIWLARKFEERPLLRWASGKWTAPEPVRDRLGPSPESVASSRTGRVVIAAAKYNDENATRELHIAEFTDGKWQWLGAPLISPGVRDTHAEDASFAFIGERPVVAWSEMRHARLAGLFVAMWDGSSWRRLGSLTPAGYDYFLTPVLAVDGKQRIWLAWNEDYGRTRVARWDGSAWAYVGADSLERLSAEQGRSVRRQLSIAVDSKE